MFTKHGVWITDADSRQSETFGTTNLPPSKAAKFYVSPDLSKHGTDGPIHVSYPQYIYNQSGKLSRRISNP